MPFFRHHTVVADATAIDLPFTGPVLHLHPSDADSIDDVSVRFDAVFEMGADPPPPKADLPVDAPTDAGPTATILPTGDLTATATPPTADIEADIELTPDDESGEPKMKPPALLTVALEGSFDGERWFRLTSAITDADGATRVRELAVDRVPPMLRAVASGVPHATRVYACLGHSSPVRTRRA